MTDRNEELETRFYNFALEIVKLVNKFPKTPAGFEMGRQLFKAGTSIPANYVEAKGAFSKEDFIYKINTAFKEARETHMWLRLSKDTGMVKEDINNIIQESKEIRNILGKSVTTAKSRNKKNKINDR